VDLNVFDVNFLVASLEVEEVAVKNLDEQVHVRRGLHAHVGDLERALEAVENPLSVLPPPTAHTQLTSPKPTRETKRKTATRGLLCGSDS
jgi:hypothetical protein